MDQTDQQTVNGVLDALVASIRGDRVSVAEIVAGLGERSFAPLLLLPALILVSPISSIPGMPTMGGLVIGLVAVQMIFGRSSLWLPAALARRSVSARKMCKAVKWLRRPASWIDRHVHPRMVRLATRPFSCVALMVCLAVTLVMPLMEFVPMLATVAASAITLFAIGLMTLDGAYIVAGYAFIGLGVGLAVLFF
ncbi:MAG: exopolysaccharide biosynthesis protein [Rhodobacteraceae bacterium]|nr:exopolysaccharide biosynthesis protein [Paracoccaceae bacterium]